MICGEYVPSSVSPGSVMVTATQSRTSEALKRSEYPLLEYLHNGNEKKAFGDGIGDRGKGRSGGRTDVPVSRRR